MLDGEREKLFLEGLTELTRKYGIVIRDYIDGPTLENINQDLGMTNVKYSSYNGLLCCNKV